MAVVFYEGNLGGCRVGGGGSASRAAQEHADRQAEAGADLAPSAVLSAPKPFPFHKHSLLGILSGLLYAATPP